MAEFSRYELFNSLIDSKELEVIKKQEASKEQECSINDLLAINVKLLKGVEEAYASSNQSILDILKGNINDCLQKEQKCFEDKVYNEFLDFLNKYQLSSQRDFDYLLAHVIRKLAEHMGGALKDSLM